MADIVIINPNSTATMTEGMLGIARATRPELEIEGWTSHQGPPAIQGREDGAAAVPRLLELVAQASDAGARSIVIGCSDDTGLAEAARLAACPVIGIGQAAAHVAALRLYRFSVVTTLAVSVPILEENIHAYGLGGQLGRVRASNVPVLGLEDDPDAATAEIAAEARRAVAEDDIDCILLGCAGMAKLTATLRREFRVPIIDGVEAATRLCAALAR
jgi:allantoin racemase